MYEEGLWLWEFRNAALQATENDHVLTGRLLEMERRFLASRISSDMPMNDEAIRSLFAFGPYREDVSDWLVTRFAAVTNVREKLSDPSWNIPRRVGAPNTRASIIAEEKSIHNERVKLNATFLNSLAVWFAGAGSAGGLITTFMASSHNFTGAGELAVIGLSLAVVLKTLANHVIGKLR